MFQVTKQEHIDQRRLIIDPAKMSLVLIYLGIYSLIMRARDQTLKIRFMLFLFTLCFVLLCMYIIFHSKKPLKLTLCMLHFLSQLLACYYEEIAWYF